MPLQLRVTSAAPTHHAHLKALGVKQPTCALLHRHRHRHASSLWHAHKCCNITCDATSRVLQHDLICCNMTWSVATLPVRLALKHVCKHDSAHKLASNNLRGTAPIHLYPTISIYMHWEPQQAGEGGSWIRPQRAGSKPCGARGAISPSSFFQRRDPKWDCTRLLALPWFVYCLKADGTFSLAS